ncbi:unnamed protein product, partial [Didymodactylos carnosus]
MPKAVKKSAKSTDDEKETKDAKKKDAKQKKVLDDTSELSENALKQPQQQQIGGNDEKDATSQKVLSSTELTQLDVDGIDKNLGGNGSVPDYDIKYEEPVLPNLIVLNYEGTREKGLFEGYGRASYVGGHTYEGNWVEGMMNGQGRYEWSDGVVYMGQIVNNQIEGVGTYHWPDGSTYSGDVYRGKRHGHGLFTHGRLPVVYDGEWHMGNMHGKGTLQFDREGTSYYIGDFIQNVPFGKGRRQYSTGNLYEGMWVAGKRHGHGIFSWANGNGEYIGQWENGVQSGHGIHVWYIVRAEESQYALRNYYDGNFVNGRRDGYGVFYYSSGTRYMGEWKNDQKHGKGKLVLRNGTEVEAEFSYDRMLTKLTSDFSTMLDIALPEIISKTPIPSASNTLDPTNVPRNESRNTMGPSFKLMLDDAFVLIRHIDRLKQIYRFYSRLGSDPQTNIDNTFLMTRLQLWRFILDCQLHSYGVTTVEYDCLIGECLPVEDIHNPNQSILVREFLNSIAIISFHLHRMNKIQNDPSVLEQPISLQIAASMENIIKNNILTFAGAVQGQLFTNSKKFIQAARYKDQCLKIYNGFCTKNPKEPYDYRMTKRDFLFMLKRLQLIDSVQLTAAQVINILAEDDVNVRQPTAEKGEVRLNIG